MPVMRYAPEDNTGAECWAMTGDPWRTETLAWRHARVAGPERVVRVPFMSLGGYAEVPITPVRFDDGTTADVGFMSMVWDDPTPWATVPVR